MSDTTFKDYSAPAVNANWLNDVNRVVYKLLGTGGAVGTAPNTRADILANLGIAASDVSYGTGTVKTALDGLTPVFATYTAAQAYTGSVTSLIISGYSAGVPLGTAGIYDYDPTDTTSTHNGALVIVLANGKRYKRSYTGRIQSAWFGTVGNGIANDTAAVNTMFAAAPLGSCVELNGILRVVSTITINRRVGIYCPSANSGFLLDLNNTAANGIVYDNNLAGIQNIVLNVNVYGKANCCNIALMLNRLDRSEDVKLNVYAGAVSYGVALNGCLINKMSINSSVNFQPPPISGVTYAFQRHHLYLSKIYGVSTNANEIWVNLEGGGIGIYSDPNMAGEGNNDFSGCIEGLSTDTPLYFTGTMNTCLRNLHLEANSQPSYFVNCANLAVRSILNPGASQALNFQNCAGVVLDDYFGEYSFDTLTSFVHVGRTLSSTSSKQAQRGYHNSVEASGKSSNINGVASTSGDDGTFTVENLFSNPFMDVWSNGGTAAPDGWYLNSSSAIKSAYPEPVYTNNAGGGFSMKLTMAGASYGSLPFAVLNSPYRQFSQDNYLSAFVPIYVKSGQPDIAVFGFGGVSTSFYFIGLVTAKDTWVDVRGSWICAAGTPATGSGVAILPWDTVNGVPLASGNGVCYVGGMNIALGTKCPKHLADHGKRATNIAPNVTYAPSFFGQQAFVAGTGKVYFAKGTASAADWLLLN